MELVLRRVAVDRLHHAYPCEHHRAVILRGLGDAMRGGLNLFHFVLGFRTSFASQAMASLSVTRFLPSGSVSGGVKRVDQDK
jgi:hypothetical protein